MSAIVSPTRKSPAPPPERTAAPARPLAAACPIVTSRELFRGSRELLIEHDGSHYRLRQTSKGKLILTK